MPRKTTTPDTLLTDLRTLLGDTEKLLQESTSATGGEAEALRKRLHDSLERARTSLHSAEQAVVEKGKAAISATEGYVSERPWQALGIAAGVGLLFGLLFSRR